VLNPAIKNSRDYYALRVVGNSMIGEGIFDGDIVIIKKQSVAENGQTVVAIIDGNETTLKKLYKEKNRFRLEPRNPSMLPIFRKEVEVRGVVVQIISNISNSPEEKILKKQSIASKPLIFSPASEEYASALKKPASILFSPTILTNNANLLTI